MRRSKLFKFVRIPSSFEGSNFNKQILHLPSSSVLLSIFSGCFVCNFIGNLLERFIWELFAFEIEFIDISKFKSGNDSLSDSNIFYNKNY